MDLNRLADLPAYFDLIDRLEGVVSTFRRADWQGAYRRQGVLGLLRELASCFTSHNAPTFYVERGSHWRGIDVERLLKRHGIRLWDRGLEGDHLYFRVERRQVKWAEYVLLRAGVPIRLNVYEPRNEAWAARHPLGDEPAQHSQWHR